MRSIREAFKPIAPESQARLNFAYMIGYTLKVKHPELAFKRHIKWGDSWVGIYVNKPVEYVKALDIATTLQRQVWFDTEYPSATIIKIEYSEQSPNG